MTHFTIQNDSKRVNKGIALVNDSICTQNDTTPDLRGGTPQLLEYYRCQFLPIDHCSALCKYDGILHSKHSSSLLDTSKKDFAVISL